MERKCGIHRLVADVAIFSGNKVLLAKYDDVTRYDGQRGWFVPDDFLVHGEHPETAAKRIARDQAGIHVKDARLNHFESFGNGAWHLIFHYRADLTRRPKEKLGVNVAALEWFDRSNLPSRSDCAHGGWAIDVIQTMDGNQRLTR
jgi:ADP-ribose pyrophosphatase YjhB (NUDIX family)